MAETRDGGILTWIRLFFKKPTDSLFDGIEEPWMSLKDDTLLFFVKSALEIYDLNLEKFFHVDLIFS